MQGDGDGWAKGSDGQKHWGKFGAAGLLLRAPGSDGNPVVLLQHRAAWSHEGGTWSIPGGARDSHEDVVAAAVREAAEEGGLEPISIAVRTHRRTAGDPATWCYTTVIADAATALATVANHESVELAWVPEAEVATMPLHPGFGASWPDLRVRPTRLLVDMANLVGSRPDGWWRDRPGAAERMLAQLRAALPRTLELPDHAFGWPAEIVAVLEGHARAAADQDGIRVLRAAGSGDDAITDLAHEFATDAGVTTLVVTADRGLRARLPVSAQVLSPGRVLDWLG
ncbi:NUDIX domain-containing protein [Tomitella biformata]|uniref:NUDIX domain-containing protein n=1 Tax=Tomitella biformata TaxID=630403 RepID=UPI0004649D62|nr:NUDIX domain-containing protein [Tomitella biformata]